MLALAKKCRFFCAMISCFVTDVDSIFLITGGIFKDSTIHDFDMTLWLSQSPAKKIFAQGQAFDPAVETCGDRDLVLVIIKHLSGSISVIDNGRRCAQGYDQRIEVGHLTLTDLTI